MPGDQAHLIRATRCRAYYSAGIGRFLAQSESEILGDLTSESEFAIDPSQRDAWTEQIRVMKGLLGAYGNEGMVAFEYVVPRVGRRIDVLLVLRHVVFVIEFKVGAHEFGSGAVDQVWDYALDLKNFHSTSHDKPIVPILVATGVRAGSMTMDASVAQDGVMRPIRAAAGDLEEAVRRSMEACGGGLIDINAWNEGRYTPTPTIVEAAMALYGKHGVEEISRSDASAINLSRTTGSIASIIRDARANSHKAICFVTGVPGAGKTLVGLDIATRHIDKRSDLYSVFLSGNGPLVKVLCEALARDKVGRESAAGRKLAIGPVRSEVKAFVQNVHHFRDECLHDEGRPPIEHVVLFDEAQRAWDKEHTVKFMRSKKKRPGFAMSEPEFLISCMDRHADWAVVVCLVGGGQEINTGEAGIGEWIRAVRGSFPAWRVHLSPNLNDSEYEAGEAMAMLSGRNGIHADADLHLGVSMRSFRAGHVSALVKSVLDVDIAMARATWAGVRGRYPIVLTRRLRTAKEWLRSKARGTERYGMVVSSQAQRLKPHAIDVRSPIDPVHWFLHGRDDVRSSYFLEDAATEFHVQGLELDWACVVWDGDFRSVPGGWDHWSFRGTEWQRIRSKSRQAYLKNAYRVLLTRARQGMVIVVPDGDPDDHTRDPKFYDSTFDYLRGIGIPVIP